MICKLRKSKKRVSKLWSDALRVRKNNKYTHCELALVLDFTYLPKLESDRWHRNEI